MQSVGEAAVKARRREPGEASAQQAADAEDRAVTPVEHRPRRLLNTTN